MGNCELRELEVPLRRFRWSPRILRFFEKHASCQHLQRCCLTPTPSGNAWKHINKQCMHPRRRLCFRKSSLALRSLKENLESSPPSAWLYQGFAMKIWVSACATEPMDEYPHPLGHGLLHLRNVMAGQWTTCANQSM